ncbi:ferredoxin [Frankia gtarii]|uniref:ferredoxin n=1 Tax=Frankia gtarii TaxID=2950102 RepID=UPI0021C0C294|nr:ferredoxin [Frankia gtarii]
MRIHMEQPECSGHGQCYLVNPELFPLDDDGFTALSGDVAVPAGAEDDARRGVAACPQQAISVLAD